MRVYMNFKEVGGAHGGANAFLRALLAWLERHGIDVSTDPRERVDVALLNALSENLTVDTVRDIAARGIPIVHRKTGYWGRGSDDMHRVVDGVVWGDGLQIEFDRWIAHTIFQSRYSRDVFLNSGFRGDHSVVYNGADDRLFNRQIRAGWLGLGRTSRTFWDGSSPFRIVISTWSSNYNKGFRDYLEIDRLLGGRDDVEVWIVGRAPADASFRHVRVLGPRSARRLAGLLKRAHAILQLSKNDTCSNALIEGLNCGLPAVYLNSGSHKEIAEPYGVEYRGNWWSAVDALKAQYETFVERLASNPYRMSIVGPQYHAILEQAIGRHSPRAA